MLYRRSASFFRNVSKGVSSLLLSSMSLDKKLLWRYFYYAAYIIYNYVLKIQY